MSIKSLVTSKLTNKRTYANFSLEDTLVPPYEVNFLVIAGGGGGGAETQRRGGGGGAGGYRCSMAGEFSGGASAAESPLSLSPGTYTVTVGAGGAGGYQGSSSVFATVTSTGGGYGGGNEAIPDTSGNGGNGGSGGGSRNGTGVTSGSGISGQGLEGTQTGSINNDSAMGGGGAGHTFLVARTSLGGGNQMGNPGLISGITGTPVWRGGGGGGGSRYGNTPGNLVPEGGLGGGGIGENSNSGDTVTGGAANTGGGGGGGDGGNTVKFGAGGSGLVVIRMKSRIPVSFSGGVTYTTTTIGDETAYAVTATSSGSETVTIG